MPLYKYVAYRVSREWNKNGNCAVVVGATYPEELSEVRKIVGDMPILIPGIGAQGGDALATVRAGWRGTPGLNGEMSETTAPIVVNSSRAILYAGATEGFAQAARHEAIRTRALLETARR